MDRIKDAPSVTTRLAATANLMVDSADRDEGRYPSPFQFVIQKNDAILNGFFNRIGTTEVVLEWTQPNISLDLNNTILYLDIKNNSISYITQTSIPGGNYTVSALLDAIVAEFNIQNSATVGGAQLDFTQVGTANALTLIATTGVYGIFNPAIIPVGQRLNGLVNLVQQNPAATLANGGVNENLLIFAPDIRPYRYIDFVSRELTYNQQLKDSSTAPIVRDVLCRWYFAYDNPVQDDTYGYPILQGYVPFVERRLFNPAKQIRWNNSQSVGQISFEVYDDQGNLLKNLRYAGVNVTTPGAFASGTDFLMTLQASED
jgi:hypothetical protein